MNNSTLGHDQLTKNQALVFGALTKADGPLSAYSILDGLRDEGLQAPPQVYRALEKLLKIGLIHRLESLNAFIACRDPDCTSHPDTGFAICDDCGDVSEFAGEKISTQLKNWEKESGFSIQKTTIELRGTCRPCKGS